MTPILPPETAQLGVRLSGPSNFMSVPEVKSSAAASDFAAGPAAAEPGKASLSDQIDHSAQRAAFLWPSQASLNTFHKAEGEASESVSMPAGKAAAEQDIDVEELEWKPGEAAGSSAGNTLEAMPIPVDQRRGFTLPQSEARCATALCLGLLILLQVQCFACLAPPPELRWWDICPWERQVLCTLNMTYCCMHTQERDTKGAPQGKVRSN